MAIKRKLNNCSDVFVLQQSILGHLQANIRNSHSLLENFVAVTAQTHEKCTFLHEVSNFPTCIHKIAKLIQTYCDMTPESRNSEVRIDVHY
jgi:hypothetical protein